LGGFPEAINRHSERRRQDWSRSYLTSILTRDLRDIAERPGPPGYATCPVDLGANPKACRTLA
jgi:hypothetical protein